MTDNERSRLENGGQVDITPLLGTWVNSNRSTEWIERFVLAKEGDTFTITAFALQQPFEWGEVAITSYADNIGEMAFHAFCDLGYAESVLAANTNKGLIVIAAFYKFKDGSGRPNFLCREFYFREH